MASAVSRNAVMNFLLGTLLKRSHCALFPGSCWWQDLSEQQAEPGLLLPVPEGFKPTSSVTSAAVEQAEGGEQKGTLRSLWPSPGRCSRWPKGAMTLSLQFLSYWEEGWDLVVAYWWWLPEVSISMTSSMSQERINTWLISLGENWAQENRLSLE